MLKARPIVDVEYYLRKARGCGEDRTAYFLGREESAGRWVGGRAEEFGLVGELDREHDHDTFRWLVTNGILPGETRRASQYSHKVKGWDLCTSAPKSVSILAALGDAGVSAAAVESHEAATAAALSYLESVVGEVRRGTDGEVREPAVPGLIGVEFRHREARPCKGCDHGDPQLHSHTVVANIQQSATDGKWFAIDGKVFKRHEMAAGYLYQSVLRHGLTARLGVTWTTPIKGLAEIAGIKTSWLRHFSKRSTAMAEYLAEQNLIDSPPARQAAVLATRLPKGERLDELTLREKWSTEAEQVGLPPADLAEAIARSGQRVARETDWDAVAGRLLGADGLTANEATFCRYDVLRELAGAGGVGVDVPELDEQVARVLGSEDVVPVLYGRDPVTGGSLPGHAPREPRYTTRAQLALEASVLDGMSGAGMMASGSSRRRWQTRP